MTDRDTPLSFTQYAPHLFDKMYIFWHFCFAGLLLMMFWRGECHSTIFWSAKVSWLMDLLLSLFCQMLLTQFSVLSFHHCTSLPLGPAYHLELPSGFFRGIEDIFFLQVHQIHLEIYLRRRTLAEIRDLIWAASVDRVISSLLLFIYKASTHWLFTWPYSRPLFEND